MRKIVEYRDLAFWPNVVGSLLNAHEAEDRLRRRGPVRPCAHYVNYGVYIRRAHAAKAIIDRLIPVSSCPIGLGVYTNVNESLEIPVPWPSNKSICILSQSKFNYDETARRLIKQYMCGVRWLVPIGVVVTDGYSPYYEHDAPTVLIDDKGRMLLHVHKPPSWVLGAEGREAVYIICRDIKSFPTEGLSHCDWCYTDTGGAPYGAVHDSALMSLCAAKKHLSDLLRVKRKLRGHTWLMTSMPGVDRDRLFRMENGDAPERIRRAVASVPGSPFHILGYIADDFQDFVENCDMYILVSNDCKIFVYLDTDSRIYKIAEDVDMFFRIGTRKIYFNSEVYKDAKPGQWDVPTTDCRSYTLFKSEDVTLPF